MRFPFVVEIEGSDNRYVSMNFSYQTLFPISQADKDSVRFRVL